jgi:hypothetical protein
MKGTTKKNFGKSGRSGAVLAFAGLFIMAMALVFGFAACETETSDPIDSLYQGTYIDVSLSVPEAARTGTGDVVVGADSITGHGLNITGVKTSGGEGLTLWGFETGSWAYVEEGSTRIGVALWTKGDDSTPDYSEIYFGKLAVAIANIGIAFSDQTTTADADSIADTYQGTISTRAAN